MQATPLHVPQRLARRLWHSLLGSLGLLLLAAPLQAEQDVSAQLIKLGMVNAQSGNAAEIGLGMRQGAEAYLRRINAAGGIHGRQLLLLSRDDGYEPVRTAQHTRELIEQAQVFALFGYVGTPTSRAAVPIAEAHQVPYLFPFSGAQFLRTPLRPGVFNLRAAYFDETAALAKHLQQALQAQRIGLLMQDDSFGETVKSGLVAALQGQQQGLAVEARIRRNALDGIEPAIRQLAQGQPDAIVFIGTYRQLAKAIASARAQRLQVPFLTVSFVGTEPFIEHAGALAEGVYISQVMPSPYDTRLPLVRRYQRDMGDSAPGYASLEGYLAAQVLVEALRRSGPQLQRQRFIRELSTLHKDFGGFTVSFAADSHQASSTVYLTRISQGRALPLP